MLAATASIYSSSANLERRISSHSETENNEDQIAVRQRDGVEFDEFFSRRIRMFHSVWFQMCLAYSLLIYLQDIFSNENGEFTRRELWEPLRLKSGGCFRDYVFRAVVAFIF